jgi:trimeric autotransporter adhesin
MVSDGNGGAIVVWDDRRNGQFSSDVYASRIKPNGSLYPVELSSFSARLMGAAVLLDWTTESESNNRGFEILRNSRDGKEGDVWETIAFVAAHRPAASRARYSYEDALPERPPENGVLYYRLRQIDQDGTFGLSHIEQVQVQSPAGIALQGVIPNPLHGTGEIRYTLDRERDVEMTIRDLLGRIVAYPARGYLPAGRHVARFDAGRLPAGVYVCMLKTGGAVQTRRFVVLP